MSVDWAAVRAEFPALERWTFLNTATFGQLPRRTTEAVAQHFAHRDDLACWDFLNWFDDADGVRESVGRLIGASGDDIAFIPNTATGLFTVVSGMEWKSGDRIVILADEFPNYLYLPALVSRWGVEVIETQWEGFYNSIHERTRMVALSTVSYINGFRVPLIETGRFLCERGVLFFVDGTQSVGALKLDVDEAQVDALAVHGYKWLLSPTGAGFLYMRRPLRDRIRPNVIGWRSHKDWREVDNLHHGTPEFKTSAEKYEGAMLPFPELYAMGASVGLMLEIGIAEIERRVLDLADQTRAVLSRLGGEIVAGDSQIVAARFPSSDVSRLARELKERRVLVSARHGNLRVSPHFYNDEADLERFEAELQKLI